MATGFVDRQMLRCAPEHGTELKERLLPALSIDDRLDGLRRSVMLARLRMTPARAGNLAQRFPRLFLRFVFKS